MSSGALRGMVLQTAATSKGMLKKVHTFASLLFSKKKYGEEAHSFSMLQGKRFSGSDMPEHQWESPKRRAPLGN